MKLYHSYFLLFLLGPHNWGKINTNWLLCSKGKNQSPINIVPKDLLFDPGLRPIKITGETVRVVVNLVKTFTYFLRTSKNVILNDIAADVFSDKDNNKITKH